jgi:hypothetical protein
MGLSPIPLKHHTLLYPPGAGGSWLISTLHQHPLNQWQPHFHEVWKHPDLMQNIHHRSLNGQKLGPSLVTLGGQSWFNFYLNLIYKLYHLERGWLIESQREFLIHKMVNMVTVIREHEIYQKNFEWEWLFYDRTKFYQHVADFQLKHCAGLIDPQDFERRCQRYIDTCVNPIMIFEDWDNLYWVCAVLGQAQYQQHKINLADSNLQSLSEQAQTLYPKLHAVPCVNTKTNLFIPNVAT